MSFQTKLDLSQQSRIHTGQTADWQGSVNIGETLRIGGFEINPRSPFLGSTLLFDGFTQSYKSGKVIGNTGIATGYDGDNLIISFTGSSTTVGPRLQSINNLATDGIMVNYGTDVTTVSLSGSSDFTLFNPSGILGANIELSLSNTGVSGGTYGSSTIIPSITVDNKGRIIGVTGTSVNIVSALSGLTDVSLLTPINNNILGYNGTNWYNTTVSNILGYTPVTEGRTLTINGESYDLTADRSWTVDTMTKICPNIVTLSGSPYYTASYGDSVYVDTDLVADNCFVTLPSSNIYGGLVYIKNLANPSTYTVSVNSFILQNGEWLLLRKGKFDAWEIVSSSLTDTPSNGNYEHGITSYGVWNALNGYIPITGTTPSGKITGDLLTNTANDVKFGIFESVPQLYLNVSSTTGIGLYYGISGAIRSKVELSNTQVNISGQTRVEMYAGSNYFHLQQSTGTSTLNTAGSFVLDAPVITLTNSNSGSYTNISTKGLLIPNISTVDRVSSNGSIAYNTLNTQFEGYRGGSWKNFLMEGDLIAYSGTPNRVTVSGATIDIASTYTGQTSITIVGTLTSGALGTGFTAIADAQIASASTWNGKFNTPTGLNNNFVSYWDGSKFVDSQLRRVTGAGFASSVALRNIGLFQALNQDVNVENAFACYKNVNSANKYSAVYISSNSAGVDILTNQAPTGNNSLNDFGLRVRSYSSLRYTGWFESFDKTASEATLTGVDSGTIILLRKNDVNTTNTQYYGTGIYISIEPSTNSAFDKNGTFKLVLQDVGNNKGAWQWDMQGVRLATLNQDGQLTLGAGLPNASAQLDLQSTTKGFGLNLIAGDLGTTRNGLMWYDTVNNLFKGVQNGGVVNLLSGSLTTNTIPRANAGSLQDSYIQELTTNVGGSIGATRPYPSVSTSPTGTGSSISGFLKWVDNGSNIGELFIYKPYTNGQGAGWYQVLTNQNTNFPVLSTSSPAIGMGLSTMANSTSTAPTNLYTGEIRNLRVGATLYGLGVFQGGAGFHYLKPFGGNNWEFSVAVNSYMRDWDLEIIGATANSGKGGGNNTLSNLSKIGSSTVKFRAMANTNSPYYYIEGVFKVNSSGAITSLVITQPSSNTTAFNVSITDTRIQFTGNAFSLAYVICEKIGVYYGDLYTTPYENERYSADATVKYWAGNGGFALGSTTINARSQLHLQSTSKGFLPNKLTTTERDAVSWVSGDAGMIIYNTTTDKHQGWNGTTWNDLY